MTKRRLIESALPLSVVNAESGREKSLRHGHISTMHLWWARRPLAMSRAVILGCLLPDPPSREERQHILDLLAEASTFEASVRAERLNPLRRLLVAAYPDGPPRVLDCFAGGGAIPLEALRLGCDTVATDLNPVAHLIQKCILQYPQQFGDVNELGGNRLAMQFVEWARWIRKHVSGDIARVFGTSDASVYFWARTMPCPNPLCAVEIPLLSSYWLAKSVRRTAWVETEVRGDDLKLRVRQGAPSSPAVVDAGTMRAASATCPACGTTTGAKDVRAYGKSKGFGSRLYAILDIDGRNRHGLFIVGPLGL